MKWFPPFDPQPSQREIRRAELRGYTMIADPHGARVVCPWLDTSTTGATVGVDNAKRLALEMAIEDSEETTRLLKQALADLLRSALAAETKEKP